MLDTTTHAAGPGLRRGLLVLLLLIGSLLAGAVFAQHRPVTLPPLRTQPAKNVELLANPGFEKPDTGWRLYDWPPRKGTGDKLIARSIFYSHDVVHGGQWALCFDHSTVGPGRILAITQNLTRQALAPYDGQRLRLSAWIWLAKGPGYYQGTLGMRQWGPPGTPPFGGISLHLGGSRGEWIHCSREFTFKLADTRRADVNIWLASLPDANNEPLVFVDDVSLEALAEPPLSANLLCGSTVFQPDDVVPLQVAVSASAWAKGLHQLQWDVTSPDGLKSYASGRPTLTGQQQVVEVKLPHLAPGNFAVRLALGATPGERKYEVLLPFRRAEGPFAK